MLYLMTGANGAGKTLFTLKDVRELQLKTNRDVYYNGRFEMLAEFGWKKIDIKDWESIPDGAIFVVDECHNDFPLRGNGAPVPRYVQQLAEHRRRGFDFFLITQHPQNIDVFVRRLIGPPGWHRHLKVVGLGMVSQAEWNHANPNCEKPGAAASGQSTMRTHPKEVYGWYSSATLHTGRPRIPKQLVYGLVALLLVPALLWFAVSRMRSSFGGSAVAGAKPAASAPASLSSSTHVTGRPGATVFNIGDGANAAAYLASRTPRLNGLPHTAPAYDTLTQPQQVPYVAACLLGKKDGHETCNCWTQQATLLTTPDALCRQVVAQGYFVDWHRPPELVARASRLAASEPVSELPPAGHGMHIVSNGRLPPAGAVPASSEAPSAGPTVLRPLPAAPSKR
ncbi:zonular occludens toxin domain-containing protein [Ramlibacter sp.]|uniref:zonular occludens toxin domain-containing protein n=1 Tax=Ramlibacter sp. TaxID=1917967 RepID=UPI0018265BCB|nr:zonular occludens toxin domain-containing protein [Ramlibacter sp.]MBA2675380.1 hypothetical protein [Ramlibacter sp.]